MSVHTQDLYAAAVEGMLPLIPSDVPLEAHRVPTSATLASPDAVIASFIGSTSADFAIALLDAHAIGAAGGEGSGVSVADVLRPALEAAANTLGAGVLGDGRVENAESLLTAPGTVAYELRAHDQLAGWVAVRIREAGAVALTAPHTDNAVADKLGRIRNVEMSLTVEIGRTRMSVRDVLALEPGDVVELDRSAGAPADILLNGRLIAHGEVVVVDQDYAVRVTKSLDVADGLA